MSDEQIQILLLIVLAALLHDTGKLFERGELFKEARTDDFYLDMCPEAKDVPNHTHLHAAHTRRFCDWLEERFDCLRSLDDKSWKDWCGAHHKNDEHGLEPTVIRLADRFSSSERDEGVYFKKGVHQKTRLEPVLERVNLSANSALATKWRYDLYPIGMGRDSIFPKRAEELDLKVQSEAEDSFRDPTQWNHLLSEDKLISEYQDLGNALLSEIESISDQNPQIGLEHLVTTLISLLEKYTANVPAATNVRHPDISLFDHLRTTAAIAQSLFLHQMNLGGTTQDIQLKDDYKWMLVCGDFSGIQNFIYNLTNQGAARGLRGRSFYVQFFCLSCAEYILRELGLTKAALLYNSGGKFYLLIPKYLKQQLTKVRETINHWLLTKFDGSVYLGLGLADVNAEMFEAGKMDTAWKQAAESLERDRLKKFYNNITADFFEPNTEFDPSKSCRVCGGRNVTETRKCEMCEILEDLGMWIRDAQAILKVRGKNADLNRVLQQLNSTRVLSFESLGVHAVFVPREEFTELPHAQIIDGECIFLNQDADLPFKDMDLPKCTISRMYLGKWQMKDAGASHAESWDFESFANKAVGISRMGILRMDVDNLGQVFVRGLQFPEREEANGIKGWGDVKRKKDGNIQQRSMASMSRMVTLSRQLDLFFSGYLQSLLERPEYSRTRIIYSGGDDLFIIGSWDQLPDLARTIREEFSEFCCQNPDMTISGGMVLQRGKYPIYKSSIKAKDAEEAGKKVRRAWKKNDHNEHKDGFCFQYVPIVWEDILYAEKIKDMLERHLKKDFQDNSTKGLLAYLLKMTAVNKSKVKMLKQVKGLDESEAWREIEYDAWRWRTAYQLKRRFGKETEEPERREWADLLFDDKHYQLDNRAILPIYTWLEFPLRWTEFLYREKEA